MWEDDDFHIIAEDIVSVGRDDDSELEETTHFEDYYDDEICELLSAFTLSVANFSNVFESEFDEIFSENCNENMTDLQFYDFAYTRCELLGEVEGYFGYILPCAFVRETVYRFKSYYKCTHFCQTAQKCLADYIKIKFRKLGDYYDSWNGLFSYCVDINEKFSDEIDSMTFVTPDEPSNGGLSKENSVTVLNSTMGDDANEILINHKTANDVMSKLDTSYDERKWGNDLSMTNKTTNVDISKPDYSEIHRTGANNFRNNSGIHSYATFFSNMSSNHILELSKAISDVLEEMEVDKTKDNNTIESDSHSNSCRESTTDRRSESSDDDEEEMTEMLDIVMPNAKFRDKVFTLLEECQDYNVPHYLETETPDEKDDTEDKDNTKKGKRSFQRRYCIECNRDVYDSFKEAEGAYSSIN